MLLSACQIEKTDLNCSFCAGINEQKKGRLLIILHFLHECQTAGVIEIKCDPGKDTCVFGWNMLNVRKYIFIKCSNF